MPVVASRSALPRPSAAPGSRPAGLRPLLPALALALLAACGRSDRPKPATSAAPPAPPAAPAPPAKPPEPVRKPLPVADMRVVIDVDARTLQLWRSGEKVATHRVAVGTKDWPTRRGEWKIVQVIWNPEWHPPQERWARERRRAAPGHPDNPLGRAQIIYDPPRSIHGTNQPQSIGKAASHGSIRVTNAVAVRLGKLLMDGTGVKRDSSWYERVQRERSRKVIVDLPQVVPITVR